MDPIYITFPVAQSLIQQAQRGDRKASELQVKVKLADGSLYDQTGKIDFIDNQVDQATDSVTVRAVIPNPQGLLKDGQIANAMLELVTPQEQLVVPQAAVLVDQVGSYVLVVGADAKVEQRRITTGAQQGVEVAVLDGLKAGEKVIVDGLQKVRPGEPVNASPTKVVGA
jgi:membrane fusion protein (multidrug efflux system)